jgi:Flp pilus assembly protein TadG
VIFTIGLVAMIAVAGLLVDGGMAWTTRRMAQNGADVGALAAAKTWSTTKDSAVSTTSAQVIASTNGFANAYTDCQGVARTNGVDVHIPPTSGAFTGQTGYVEVIVQRPLKTGFSQIVGQGCWMVSARAVAIATTTEVAGCSFCSLNNSNHNHTLVLKNSATLRVDGDIYVNSTNGGTAKGTCTPLTKWKVCGDGFDIFGDGGTISAKTISVVGGWETHDQNIALADAQTAGCDSWDPPSQVQTSNVCIHMPTISDPLNDSSRPASVITPPVAGARPTAGLNGCPTTAAIPSGTVGAPSLMTVTSGSPTICPGTYWGGLKVTGGTVTMQPGVYIMVGGGFQVIDTASVDGSAGVMIYSEGGGSAAQSTTTANDLVPDPVPGHTNLNHADLTSSDTTIDPGATVTFTMTLSPSGAGSPAPTGTVDFYDGNAVICSASPVSLVQAGKNPVKATCTTTFPIYGTRAISAVYSGDATYNPDGDTLTQTVKTPGGVTTGPITIETTGRVDLFGPRSGPYAGLTLFQERTSDLTLTLAPGNSSAGACPANFMTNGAGSDPNPVPDPCGAIGGLQGTVYAAHQDALVLIEASGMADLQVISGKIEVDSDANARFGYDASKFANSSIHLVE